MDDIVVTSRFVSENIQDTPLAITAQTATQLEAAHVVNIGTLGAVVPNLWTVPGDSQGAGTPRISLRGVQQGGSSSLAVPPAVAIYTDDVYHATTAGSELDLIDIDHIEVNRGPQSTLSGNASIGGAIKIYSKDPTGDGSGFIEVTGGSRNKQGISGASDFKLTDTLSMRVSANIERQTGFVDRLDFTCEMNKLGTPALAGTLPIQQGASDRGCVTGHLGGGQTAVGQIKLRWRPNDKLDVLLTGRHREEDMEETPETGIAYQPNPINNPNTSFQGYNNLTQAAFGIQVDSRFLAPPGSGGYATYATNCRPFYPAFAAGSGYCYPQGKTASHDLISGKVHYDFSDTMHLTAIAAHTEYENEFTQNGDQSPLGYVLAHFHNYDSQDSGEARLDGTLFGGKLNWVTGLYALRLDGHQDNNLGIFALAIQNSKVSAINNSKSGFFHLDYNLTDKWRVSGGARYSDSDITINIINPPLLSTTAPVVSEAKRWDWLISSDFKITDDVLLYASAATGSRPAGVQTIVNTARQYSPTPEEELISYDAGIKAEFLDHKLRANIDAFYTDYSKLSTAVTGFECIGQPGPTATLFVNRSDCLQFTGNTGVLNFTYNVGIPSKISGFEWDITALPIEGLRIDFTGGYNHFESSVKTPGAPGYLWPGNHRQPTWNAHADAAYDIHTGLGLFTPRIDWSWQSQQDFDTQSNIRAPLPILVIKAYSIYNAGLAYKPSEDSNWSASLQVTNLADKYYYYQIFSGTINAQTRVAPPREFSVSIRRNF